MPNKIVGILREIRVYRDELISGTIEVTNKVPKQNSVDEHEELLEVYFSCSDKESSEIIRKSNGMISLFGYFQKTLNGLVFKTLKAEEE